MGDLEKHAPVVLCPGCDVPMKAVEQKPVRSVDGLSDVTYFCEKCRTKNIRTTKPIGTSDPAP